MDDEKQQKVIKDIRKISVPDIVKRNLINASLLLTAYELMKDSLIRRVNDFFLNMRPGGSIEFINEIKELRKQLPINRRKHYLLVYTRWFEKHGALIEGEVEDVEKIRDYRNKVAHELLDFLVDSDFELDLNYLVQIRDILEKVDIWWVKEIEIPVNQDFDNIEVKDSDIKSGKMVVLDYLLSIALELGQDIEKNRSGLVH